MAGGQAGDGHVLAQPVGGVHAPGGQWIVLVDPFAAVDADFVGREQAAAEQVQQQSRALKLKAQAGGHRGGAEHVMHRGQAALVNLPPRADALHLIKGQYVDVLPVVRVQRGGERQAHGLRRIDFAAEQAADRLGVQAAAGVIGMQRVGQPFVPAQEAVHHQIEGIARHVDAAELIVLGQLLPVEYGLGQIAREHGLVHGLGVGVGQHDVAHVVLHQLAQYALAARAPGLFAVVDRRLDKDQIAVVGEYVVLDAQYGVERAGRALGGVFLIDNQAGELGDEPVDDLAAPAMAVGDRLGDRAADEADGDVAAADGLGGVIERAAGMDILRAVSHGMISFRVKKNLRS